jgi:drug/metabolite transporter (DMT)-like permease
VLGVAQATGATRRIKEIARGWVAVRAVVDAIATVLFLVSLFHLPLANATAINMASPLIITVLAAVFLGERLGRSRWVAVGVGFLGVLLIIQPEGKAFNTYALVCLLSTVLLSVRDLVTRRVHAAVPSILVTLSNTLAVTLLAGGLTLFEGWRPFTGFELLLLAVVAVFLSSAYYLIVISTRRGDLSLIAPFRYTAILFATVAGFVIWGDTPNALAWCGIALVIASGIYVLRVSRRASRAPITAD